MSKKIPKLDKPMSELIKDRPNPTADIEAYVHRSAEERHKETAEGKVPGKVKRPLNAFMLYRKAYQNLVKDWCSQHNHRVISQVCGNSWPLEPEHVRLQFYKWARIERDNHRRAHPGYKLTLFRPQKQKCHEARNEIKGFENKISKMGTRSSGTISWNRPLAKAPIHEPDDNCPPLPAQQSYYATTYPNNDILTFGFNTGKTAPTPYNCGYLAASYSQATHSPSPQGQHRLGVDETLSMRMTPSTGFGAYHPHLILPDELSEFNLISFFPSSAYVHIGLFVDQTLRHPMALGAEQYIDPALLSVNEARFDGSPWIT